MFFILFYFLGKYQDVIQVDDDEVIYEFSNYEIHHVLKDYKGIFQDQKAWHCT
jgi:hypothetical protein